ncbi:MAG: hypothetical protein JWO52_4090 [Gammaproteobacteria bacterium]|nr:hypothetical protein [Gammaproteobacteria bacterium]
MSPTPTPRRPSCLCGAGYWQGHCISCHAAARPVTARHSHFARWWHVYLTVLTAAVIGWLLAGEML